MEEDTTEAVPWRAMVRLPGEWGERVERLADEQGVPVAIMLRLLVHAGLERWEAWMAERALATRATRAAGPPSGAAGTQGEEQEP